MEEDNKTVHVDADDLFSALGFDEDEARDLSMKSRLFIQLKQQIRAKNWTQKEIGQKLDVPQSRVSELMTGKIDLISTDKLLGYIEKLGFRVEAAIVEDRREKKKTRDAA